MKTALIDFTDSNGNTWEVYFRNGEMDYDLKSLGEGEKRSRAQVDAAGLNSQDDSDAWFLLSQERSAA